MQENSFMKSGSKKFWELLVACHRTKSLGLACRQINMTPSAASKLISSFESSTGIELLNRRTRPAQLTANLDGLIPIARKLIEDLEQAQRTIYEMQAEKSLSFIPARIVRIAFPVNVRSNKVLRKLLAYSSSIPNLRLEFYGDDCFKRLMLDEVEIAQFGFHPGRDEIEAQYIRTNGFFILASQRFISKFGEPKTVEELSNFPVVIRNPSNRSFSRRLENGDNCFFLPETSNIIYGDTTTCVSLLLAGEAISIDVSISSVLHELKTRQVFPILKGWHRKPNDTYVCCKKNNASDPIISDLMSIIRTELMNEKEDNWLLWAKEFGMDVARLRSSL